MRSRKITINFHVIFLDIRLGSSVAAIVGRTLALVITDEVLIGTDMAIVARVVGMIRTIVVRRIRVVIIGTGVDGIIIEMDAADIMEKPRSFWAMLLLIYHTFIFTGREATLVDPVEGGKRAETMHPEKLNQSSENTKQEK